MALSIDYKPSIVSNKPNAYEVIKYMNNDLSDYPNELNDFYVLFDSYKLDSKNFVLVLSFFDDYDYKITEIYPYINPMYNQLLSEIETMSYNHFNLGDGIADIYNRYMKKLEEYRLSDEIDKVLVNGVRIRMIKINITNDIMASFIKKYPGVKYSLTSSGLFLSN
jgi:hypothetical protein